MDRLTEQPRTSPAVPMKRYKSWIGIGITLLAVTWPCVAVWLHAYQFIGNITETYTCWYLCLPAAVFGPAYYWSKRKSEKLWQKFLTLLLAVVTAMLAMTIIVTSRVYSDRMFTFWIMKRIPDRAWQQMISDINALARGLGPEDDLPIVAQNLPKSFSLLGSVDEYFLGAAMNHEGQFWGATVRYGDRNRRWGLLVGFERYENSWRKFKRIPVATNAWFFIGPDW